MFQRLRQLQADWTPAAVGSNETTALFTVRAGERVVAASAECLTSAQASTTSTQELGDGTDTDGFITTANFDIENTAGTIAQGTGALLLASLGKLYTADDTVDVKYVANSATGTKPVVRYRIWTLREK